MIPVSKWTDNSLSALLYIYRHEQGMCVDAHAVQPRVYAKSAAKYRGAHERAGARRVCGE